MNRHLGTCAARAVRSYASKWPRPRPGSAERPLARVNDPLANNPHAEVTQLDDNLVFIRRPPPTAPSPLSLSTNPVSPLLRPPTIPPSDSPPRPLPPYLRKSANKEPQNHLTEEDIQKIRVLRKQDPYKYTATVLAKMFKCSSHFILLVAALKKPMRNAKFREREEVHQAFRNKWSERHSLVKATQQKRRQFW